MTTPYVPAQVPSSGEPPPAVSVIVPVRNAARSLPSLLDALGQQTLVDPYEVIVADDCSTDDTAEVVGRSPLARLVSCPRHEGSYAARNLALSVARGEVLAFTDGDCLPAARWLEAGLEALRRSGVDLLAGHIEMPLGPRPSLTALVDCSRHLDQESAVASGCAVTANLLVRRRVFDRIGCFNGRLIAGGDVEFTTRAVAAGARLAYHSDAVVSHAPRDRPRVLARKGFRAGYARAQHRLHAEGPVGDRPALWSRPGNLLPRRRIYSVERLERSGHPPSRRELAGMYVVQYLAHQLPMVAGDLAGEIVMRGHRPAS